MSTKIPATPETSRSERQGAEAMPLPDLAETRQAAKAAQSLEDTFYAVLRDRPAHQSRHEQTHVYASEALQCRRKVWYRLVYATREADYDASTLVAFKIGEELHKVVQAALKQRYADAECEVVWSLGAVTGRADGVYTDAYGRKVVVEVKTSSVKSFNRAVSAGTPEVEHIMQANLSALALGAERLHLIYIRKERSDDDAPYVEWLLPASRETAEAELRAAQRIVTLYDARKLPPRSYQGEIIDDPAKRRWPCQWCPFKARCLSDG